MTVGSLAAIIQPPRQRPTTRSRSTPLTLFPRLQLPKRRKWRWEGFGPLDWRS
jgi:hypothetical protein